MPSTQVSLFSGAIDEDHNQLKVLRDDVQRTSVLYERLMTELDDKISREIQILNDERQYMKDLSSDDQTSTTKLKKLKVAPLNYDNAILVIKFDDTSFDYSTALFESISNALEQIPSAAFEVVAVSPTSGPTYAENARDRASEVFSKIVEMGVPTERVSITSSTSTSAQAEEVHIYLKN